VATIGSVGAGAFPDAELPGAAVALAGDAERWARRLRAGSSDRSSLRRSAPSVGVPHDERPAVVGRVHDGRLHLDLRAVLPKEMPELVLAVIGARE
jgi:hypothetical protein